MRMYQKTASAGHWTKSSNILVHTVHVYILRSRRRLIVSINATRNENIFQRVLIVFETSTSLTTVGSKDGYENGVTKRAYDLRFWPICIRYRSPMHVKLFNSVCKYRWVFPAYGENRDRQHYMRFSRVGDVVKAAGKKCA